MFWNMFILYGDVCAFYFEIYFSYKINIEKEKRKVL